MNLEDLQAIKEDIMKELLFQINNDDNIKAEVKEINKDNNIVVIFKKNFSARFDVLITFNKFDDTERFKIFILSSMDKEPKLLKYSEDKGKGKIKEYKELNMQEVLICLEDVSKVIQLLIKQQLKNE